MIPALTPPGAVRGALWMLGSTLAWALMAGITRYLKDEMHTFEIVFFRSLFGAMFLLPWLCRLGLDGLRTQRFGMHMLRGFLGLAAIHLLFTAVALAPLAEVAAIISTRPVIASLGAIVILRGLARRHRWAATGLAFAGALIIVRLGISEVSPGVVLALLSVVIMAALKLHVTTDLFYVPQ